MPKLSIIIPTFNSAATIQRCLHSIRIQTLNDYEIVIQDGASPDRTAELIREFVQDNPEVKLELKQEPDKGAYDAMNRGMRRANGEWLYFLGSDDEFYDQNVLGKMLGSGPAADIDVLYGNVKMIGRVNAVADGTIYDGPFDLAKLLRKNICHQAIFYRASLLREVGSYNPEYPVLADWDLNMRCWAKGQFRYMHVTVAKFYAGGISSQYRPDPQFYADVKTNEIRYFGKKAEQARRTARIAPRRVLRALARRLEITRWK